MSERHDVHESHRSIIVHGGENILIEKKDAHVRICGCIISMLRKEIGDDHGNMVDRLSLWMHWLRSTLLSYGVPEDQIDIVLGGSMEGTGDNPYYGRSREDIQNWEILATIEKISEHGAGFFKTLDFPESFVG